MSLLGFLTKAVAVIDAAGALLDRALPKRRPKKRAPTELDSADVAVQNRASHVPEAHKVAPVRPSSRYDD